MVKMPTLMDDVLADPPITSLWFATLPEDFRQEMNGVREAFTAGKLPYKRYPLAARIRAHAKKRGIKMPSEKTVAEWLRPDEH